MSRFDIEDLTENKMWAISAEATKSTTCKFISKYFINSRTCRNYGTHGSVLPDLKAVFIFHGE